MSAPDSSRHSGAAPDLSLARLNIIVPEGVRFDGRQRAGARVLLCFTDTTIKPVGASFSLGEKDITSVRLNREVARLRRQFGPIQPLYQRAPRLFVSGGEIYK